MMCGLVSSCRTSCEGGQGIEFFSPFRGAVAAVRMSDNRVENIKSVVFYRTDLLT